MGTVDQFFESTKRTKNAWLRDRTVFLTRHGSHAYGLNTPASDEDFKGVAIPPRAYLFGFANAFEQAECKDPDLVIYDIRKFFRLASDCNPNIVEVLWTQPEDHVLVTPIGRELLDHRASFLSRKARFTFSGYATAQLKRINTHYKWLKDPPTAPPQREDFGLLPGHRVTGEQNDQIGAALTMIQREVGTWDDLAWTELDDAAKIGLKAKISDFLARARVSKDDVFVHTGRQLGFDENFLAMLQQEKAYRAKKQEWDNYQGWLVNRNKARSELEAKFGYDTKHAMHLVRLLRMAREILETGNVTVKRPDREELLDIRRGAWTYQQLVEWAADQDSKMDALYEQSPLPRAPDVTQLDALCTRLVESLT
jgi:predicted nucleotidyltransferase